MQGALTGITFIKNFVLVSDIESEVRSLIGKGQFIEAYRYIFKAYPQINSGLREGKDFNIWPKVVPVGGFKTEPAVKIEDRNGVPALPTTYIDRVKFDQYMANELSYGGLVRAVYHESVHINLQLGSLAGFAAIYPTVGDGKSMHEVIASYHHLTNKSLPTMNAADIRAISTYGQQYYNNIQHPKSKSSLSYMNTVFTNNLK